MSIQAMKQAVLFLENEGSTQARYIANQLIAAIEAAERQEPICYLCEEWMQYVQSSDADPHAFPVFTTPQPAIPDGWQLVPVEPTEEMLTAMRDGAYGAESEPDAPRATVFDCIRLEYKAMLAAAPKPKEMK